MRNHRTFAAALAAVIVTTVLAGCNNGSSGDGDGLDGIYRLQWTAEELTEAGFPADVVPEIYGVFTITFDDGQFTMRQTENTELTEDPATGRSATWCGPYTADADRFSVRAAPGSDCAGAAEADLIDWVAASWTVTGGELLLSEVTYRESVPGDELVQTWFTSKPWQKLD